MTDANLTQAVATAAVATVVADAAGAAPTTGAVATRQTAMTKGFAFLSEVDKLGPQIKATVLEDLGLLSAAEKKRPFTLGFIAGLVVAVAAFVLFASFGHH